MFTFEELKAWVKGLETRLEKVEERLFSTDEGKIPETEPEPTPEPSA